MPRNDEQNARAENGGTIPSRFTPKFWQYADRRVAVVREVESRVQRMKDEAGADSYQLELVAERAAFMAILIETWENEAVESGTLDLGQYVQATNSLLGLLRTLGLERKVKKIGLSQYLEEQRA